MSGIDYLDDEQTEELVQQLEELEIELESSLAASREGSKPVDLDEPIGRLSRMDAIQQQQMATATRRRAEQRLQRVRAALAAAESGTYGECKICEEPIGFRRLSVQPETPICVRCQSERESR